MTMTTEREAQVKMLISFFNVRSGCRYKFSKDANQIAMNNVIEAAGGNIHKVKAYFRETVQTGADLGDLDNDRRIGVFARNFIQDKAQEMGYQYHLQLDDDIHGFAIRYIVNDKLACYTVRNMDVVIDAMLDYMDSAPFTSLSFGLPAYYMGGMNNNAWKKRMIPKTMTTFIMRADDKQYFHMRMNDDITTSALNNMRGKMYYSYLPCMVELDPTQVQKGGMTEIYQDNGTYRKSFYTVMALPSCTKISSMGVNDYRVHHQISWNHACPKILSEKWRKI